MYKLSDETFTKEVTAAPLAVLDFMAEWCQPCKPVSVFMERLEKEFSMVKFYKVDVDKMPRVTGLFDIQSVPTILFFVNGKPITSLEGKKITESTVKTYLQHLDTSYHKKIK